MAYTYCGHTSLHPQWPTTIKAYIHSLHSQWSTTTISYCHTNHSGLQPIWSAATLVTVVHNQCSLQPWLHGVQPSWPAALMAYNCYKLQSPCATSMVACNLKPLPTPKLVCIHSVLQTHRSTFPDSYSYKGQHSQWPTATQVYIHRGLQPQRSTFTVTTNHNGLPATTAHSHTGLLSQWPTTIFTYSRTGLHSQ